MELLPIAIALGVLLVGGVVVGFLIKVFKGNKAVAKS